MAQVKTLYALVPKTDLHVGAGGEVAGIIDNLVQRNSTTGFPCINNSSLKGAVKQHAHNNNMLNIKEIFGSDTSVNTGTAQDDSQQGNTAFGQAELLALAVPSDKTMFLLITCGEVLDLYLENLQLYGIDVTKVEPLFAKINRANAILCQEYAGAYLPLNRPIGANVINVTEPEKLLLKEIFGYHYKRLAVISNQDFIELTSDFYLPVAAHNAIDDGKSDNLFYTQNLPMQSVFYFINVSKNTSEDTTLTNCICGNGLVHIGAHYSTSQGFCKINKVAQS